MVSGVLRCHWELVHCAVLGPFVVIDIDKTTIEYFGGPSLMYDPLLPPEVLKKLKDDLHASLMSYKGSVVSTSMAPIDSVSFIEQQTEQPTPLGSPAAVIERFVRDTLLGNWQKSIRADTGEFNVERFVGSRGRAWAKFWAVFKNTTIFSRFVEEVGVAKSVQPLPALNMDALERLRTGKRFTIRALFSDQATPVSENIILLNTFNELHSRLIPRGIELLPEGEGPPPPIPRQERAAVPLERAIDKVADGEEFDAMEKYTLPR
jgi:hypothetical protein